MRRAITIQATPATIGPYSQAIKTNDTLSISGQVPLDPATDGLSANSIRGQTKQVSRDVGAVLKEAGFGFERVMRATIYLADVADFAAMSEVYAEFFAVPYPMCAAFQITIPPKNAKVEVGVAAVRTQNAASTAQRGYGYDADKQWKVTETGSGR